MSKLITTKERALALTAWLNVEAGNPSDFNFPMYALGAPEVFFCVDLNGTEQCNDFFLIFTREESATIAHSFELDRAADVVFNFKGVDFIINTTASAKTKPLLKFSPRSNSYGLYYFPENAEACQLLKKGRKTFRGDDLTAFLSEGYRVALDISQTLGGDPALVELKPLTV